MDFIRLKSKYLLDYQFFDIKLLAVRMSIDVKKKIPLKKRKRKNFYRNKLTTLIASYKLTTIIASYCLQNRRNYI